ncbi:glycosyl transferase [Bacteroidota bacterium]|nr:glycosyl transferase [Bacteroidota bacterium]
MLKRLFDILSALIVFIILSPVYVMIALLIVLTSPGGVLYRQPRIGIHGKVFTLYKFRTMYSGADKKGLLTVGMRDNRITGVGYYLRKYKLDELPQLFNIIRGDMSVVGPRPEVEKYVALYNAEQRNVLSVRPGLTDLASLEYIDENKVLAQYTDAEKAYIEHVMPHKLALNLEYISKQSLLYDLQIIIRTLLKLF